MAVLQYIGHESLVQISRRFDAFRVSADLPRADLFDPITFCATNNKQSRLSLCVPRTFEEPVIHSNMM